MWHLHLLHSRDYWDIWCGQVLGTRLHHDPTEGGPAALAKHAEQYAQTLALYEQHFGPPPEPFWPSTQSRFHNAARFRAVDARAWLIMPRVTAFFTKRRLPFPTR